MSEPSVPFKPSDLPRFLEVAMPYVATFGRAERELGVALYVEACRANDDAWQPADPPALGRAFKALAEMDQPPTWITFMARFGVMPDIHGLCDAGFFTKPSEHGPITPTRLFFERIAQWVPADHK